MEVVSNSVHRQLTLPRAVCLAVSARVAPEDVAGVATAHQAFTIITIMLSIISIILSSQSLYSNIAPEDVAWVATAHQALLPIFIVLLQ